MDLPPYNDYGGLAYLAGMVEVMVYIDSLTPYLPYLAIRINGNLIFLIYGLSRAAGTSFIMAPPGFSLRKEISERKLLEMERG